MYRHRRRHRHQRQIISMAASDQQHALLDSYQNSMGSACGGMATNAQMACEK